MAWVRPPLVTLLVFLLSGLLIGVLSEVLGLLAGPGSADTSSVVECLGFPSEGQRKSTSQVHVAAQPGTATSVELDFLDVDSSILKTRQLEIDADGQAWFELPTWQMGLAIQIISPVPITVDVTLVYDGSVGPPERRPVPCTPHGRAVRAGGA